MRNGRKRNRERERCAEQTSFRIPNVNKMRIRRIQ